MENIIEVGGLDHLRIVRLTVLITYDSELYFGTPGQIQIDLVLYLDPSCFFGPLSRLYKGVLNVGAKR